MAAAVKNLRLTSDRFVLLGTGDHFGGYIYSRFGGMPEVELFNYFRYDGMLVGKEELSLGEDVFDAWARMARFPIILTNLIAPPQCKLCRHAVNYTTLERSGLIVGIFGLLPPELPRVSRVETDISLSPDILEIASNTLSILKEQRCDIIVLLSGLSMEENYLLAEELCDIDLIVCSEWGDFPGEPILVENGDCRSVICCSRGKGASLGILHTSWDEGGSMVSYKWAPRDIDSTLSPDPRAATIISEYTDRIPSSQTIGRSETELDGRRELRSGAESNLCNLITDAMMAAYPDADLAILPAGSIFGSPILRPGIISDRWVESILPYRENAVVAEIPGEILRKSFERAAAFAGDDFGGFLQLSGGKVIIDSTRTPQRLFPDSAAIETEGKRIRRLEIGGEKLDDDRTYRIIAPDYLFSGGYGNFWFSDIEASEVGPISELVIEYIESSGEVSPPFEGSIIVNP